MSRRSPTRDPGVMTLGQAARTLGVDRDAVRGYVLAGLIPRLDGDQLRLRRADVEDLKTRMETTGR